MQHKSKEVKKSIVQRAVTLADMRKRMHRDAANTNKSMREYMLPTAKELHAMSTPAQKAFFSSLAMFGRAAADLLDEMAKGEAPAAATAAAAPAPKPAKAPKPAPVAVAAPAPAAAAPAPAAAATVTVPAAANGAADLMTQTRAAAKSYAEVYGREGLKEVLSKFTTGTVADVPPEKLPELIAALS